jgi:hypothetical protein
VSTVARSANNTIINNLIYGANLQAFSSSLVPNSGLVNVLIANNTIVDGPLITGHGGTMNITNINSQIRNNIFFGTGSPGTIDATGITFSNNNWKQNIVGVAGPGDVTGDPLIARTGSTAPGQLSGNYFKLSSASSPIIDKAVVLSLVNVDYFGTARGTSPDIGGYEFIQFLTVIDSRMTNRNLIICPNPTSGRFKLVFDRIPQDGSYLKVTDMRGKTIIKKSIQNKEEWIDLNGNSPGIYLILTNINEIEVQKVIFN